jgi:isoleucyl-tRNA synthetase
VKQAIETHREIIAEELNVKTVSTSPDDETLVVLSAKANFRRLGPTLGPRMGEVAAAIADLDHAAIESIRGGAVTELEGHPIGIDDLIIERTPRPGTVVETGTALAVALNIELTDDLRLEGLAREVVSRIQKLRRAADLDVTDRINVSWRSDDTNLTSAIERHRDEIAAEVLAVGITCTPDDDLTQVEIGDIRLGLEISRV